jgi:O-acetyl-ADP-ribose deacetylase (regulator of RNase III)
MRIPENVVWNREVVYNCMWSLLVSLEKHNEEADDGTKIRKVLMTGFGTGTGGVSAERCAHQMALAIRDFIDACENVEKWRAIKWADVMDLTQDCRRTHILSSGGVLCSSSCPLQCFFPDSF